MEEMFWKFPHIGEQTFKILSNKNLEKCKIVCRSWYHFIKNDKFCEQRVHYENIQKKKGKFGKTQLHRKAKDGQLSECRLIIDHVENKNPVDYKGHTPLHLAATQGHLDVCKLIVEKITNKNPREKNGVTPLHLAAFVGHLDVCKLIIEKIAAKNPKDKDGWTPLHIAAQNSHLDILQTHH